MKKLFIFYLFFCFILKADDYFQLKKIWEKTKRNPFEVIFSEKKKEEFEKIIKQESSIIEVPVLNIKGILISDKERYVLIENKILKEGDIIDEFKIKNILYDKIIIEKDNQNFEIFLKRGGELNE